jgi:hypothetical protein
MSLLSLCCQKTKGIQFEMEVNKFNFLGEGGGERGVKGGVDKKEEGELKEQINMKVSTKFQNNPSINGLKKCTQNVVGMDRRMDHRTDGPTDEVFYRGACWRLNILLLINRN